MRDTNHRYGLNIGVVIDEIEKTISHSFQRTDARIDRLNWRATKELAGFAPLTVTDRHPEFFQVIIQTASGSDGEFGAFLSLVGGLIVTWYLYRRFRGWLPAVTAHSRKRRGWRFRAVSFLRRGENSTRSSAGASSHGSSQTAGPSMDNRPRQGNTTRTDRSGVSRLWQPRDRDETADDRYCLGCGNDLQNVIAESHCPYCGRPLEHKATVNDG